MKNDTKKWLSYADENLLSAKILLNSHLYNPTLQNIQQSFEKYLKAIFFEKSLKLQKTHSIRLLLETLKKHNIFLDIDEDTIDLIDSIYLPSKYHFGSVLADYEPNENICKKLLLEVEKLKQEIKKLLK